jgi:hypothetical protein
MLLDAVERKYGGLLRQVTLEDEESLAEMEAQFAANAFGSQYVHKPAFRRIDGLLMIGRQRTAIEVKVTRADFRNDTDAKRRAWIKHSHRFVYLTPPGLLDPKLMPVGCGLWESDGTTVTVVKNATIRKGLPPLPESFFHTVFWRLILAENKTKLVD